MKNKEIDFEDPLEIPSNEKEFFDRFQVLDDARLDQHRERIAKSLGTGKKSRVTIYFDNRVLDRFKALAEESKVGYQTLMNEALLSVVDGMEKDSTAAHIKEDLLNDRKFLHRLKNALSS